MLTRLLPDQISQFWDVIKYAIEQSLPPIAGESPGRMNRILTSLISGGSDCWASYTIDGDQRRFEAIVITKMLYDDVSDTKNLLIYCLYGYEIVDRSSWASGLKSLVKYASGKGCHNIVAYTDVPGIVDLVKRLGGEAKQTFISLPVR